MDYLQRKMQTKYPKFSCTDLFKKSSVTSIFKKVGTVRPGLKFKNNLKCQNFFFVDYKTPYRTFY